MRLDDAAYGHMAAALAGVADRSASGRLALLLEGGYDLSAIQGALGASLDAALGPSRAEPRATGAAPIDPRHAAEIAEARRVASARWSL
jgi:acetoin utilization deacetylase AcuC-like enzyme